MAEERTFQEQIETCSEVELYLIIDSLGYLQWRMRHDSYRDSARGNIGPDEAKSDDKVINDLSERVTQAVSQVKRFGFEPFAETGDPKSGGSKDYWLWYRWWDAWKKGMNSDQWLYFEHKLMSHEDITDLLPQGSWRES